MMMKTLTEKIYLRTQSMDDVRTVIFVSTKFDIFTF